MLPSNRFRLILALPYYTVTPSLFFLLFAINIFVIKKKKCLLLVIVLLLLNNIFFLLLHLFYFLSLGFTFKLTYFSPFCASSAATCFSFYYMKSWWERYHVLTLHYKFKKSISYLFFSFTFILVTHLFVVNNVSSSAILT